MNRTVFGAALMAASALTAPAFAGDFGVKLEGFAANVTADADYINDDKLDNGLDGTLAGVRVGADYTFGEGRGLVLGVNYATTLGEGITSEPVRNGNYLTHHATLNGFESWELTAGWDFGQFTAFVGYGELTRDTDTFQSCPEDWNAVVAGFCRGGGVPATAESREGLRGGNQDDSSEQWRLGAEYEINDRFYLTGSYAQAEFGQTVTSLDVVGTQAPDRVAHPDTAFAQDFDLFQFGVGIRF